MVLLAQTGLSSSSSICDDFVKSFLKKRVYVCEMANIVRINIDKAPVRQLLKVVVKAEDEINETSFVHGQNKRRLQIQSIAHGRNFARRTI